MARIVGGIAAPRTPTLGFAFDRDSRSDPAYAATRDESLEDFGRTRNPSGAAR